MTRVAPRQRRDAKAASGAAFDKMPFCMRPKRKARWHSPLPAIGAATRRFEGVRGHMSIRTGPLGIGPPQAAWRGAVEHPSGGPSAPGRRCWRLGRKRPSPFSNSGPTPLRSDPNLEGLKSLRCCCAKGWGAAAAPQARARSGSTLAIHIHAEKLTVGVVTARGCAH